MFVYADDIMHPNQVCVQSSNLRANMSLLTLIHFGYYDHFLVFFSSIAML